MLDRPRSEAAWEFWATHSIRQFPLHFPSRASPCATRFRTNSTRYACPILTKLAFSGQIFEKYSLIKFYENPSSGAKLIHADRHDDPDLASRQST